MTYQDIENANKAIKTTDIKGKDYAEVNQRIKAFRMVHPEGTISTDLISNENGMCIFKATISDKHGVVLGTGTAYEKENSSFINKTSYIENCETSAVGRALGMCGFGIDTSVASYEEVANAIEQQNTKKKEPPTMPTKVTPGGVDYIHNLCLETGTDESKVLAYYKVSSFYDMDIETYNKACREIEKKLKG